MKRILLLLLLFTIYIFAQPGFQGRKGYQQSILWFDLHKSTQDTIKSIIGDSANTNIINFLEDSLNADNGIVYNVPGRVISLKIVKDTTTIKAYTPDSTGVMVYLKQLSSANTSGGGSFIYKSSGSAVNGVSYAASGGGIWEREEWQKEKRLYMDWYGAKGDDSSDNLAAFNSAYLVARAQNAKQVIFSAGTFRFSDSLLCLTNGNQTAMPEIVGMGYNNTTLKWTTDVAGIVFTNTAGTPHRPVVSGVRLQGPGNATSTKYGVYFKILTLGIVKDCFIDGWEYGIYRYQDNASWISNNFITLNNFGIYGVNAPNEGMFIDNYIVFNDSIQYVQYQGNTNAIYGGAIAGGETDNGDIGVWVGDGGICVLRDVNMELHKEYVLWSDVNATIRAYDVQAGYNSTYKQKFARINGGFLTYANCTFSGVPADCTAILQTGTSSRITNEGTRGTQLRTLWTNFSDVYYPAFGVNTNLPGAGSFAADSTTRGRYGWYIYDDAGNFADRPVITKRMKNGEYVETQWTLGDNWMLSSSNVQPGVPTGTDIAFRSGTLTKAISSNALDTTRVLVVADTNGWGTLYGNNLSWNIDNLSLPDSAWGWSYQIGDTEPTPGNGRIIFVLKHPNYSGGTFRFYWWALIAPLGWAGQQ